MKILHPNKEEYCSLNELSDYYSNGFYSIISKDEKEKLDYFLKAFQEYRKSTNATITDANVYKNLPFSIDTPVWKERQKDAKIMDALIKDKKELEILDVGSWNGWLCNYLSKKGHNVTGTGLFTDEFDGLKSKKHYQTDFTLLQIQVDQLFRIKKKFDLIIFNRNWAFNQDSETVLNHAKKMLTNNGKIICTGLAFYKNASIIKQHFKTKNIEFKKQYNVPLFYKESKGYLDFNDKKLLINNKMQLKPYNAFKNYLKYIFPKKPIVLFGVYAKENKDV